MSDNGTESLLDAAIHAARKAGDYLLAHFKKDLSLISARGTAKEITTTYDKTSDRLLVDALHRHFPDHNFLTEESGSLQHGGNVTWIIDSLDGSGNYASGNPFFAVSIAAMVEQTVTLGVILAPFLDELYAAQKNKGAYLNGREIHVSNIATSQKAYYVSCEGGACPDYVANINARIHPLAKDVRKLGSAALEGAWVASGRAEAYWTTSIDPWDVAAAVLLVSEAGGQVTDFHGSGWQPTRSNVLMSNRLVHRELLEMIASVNSSS